MRKKFAIIVPAFPRVSVFSKQARKISPLGPVLIGTIANKLKNWDVIIYNENNYTGPRDKDGLPDHRKLQDENPADAVGLSCGLTCAMDRAYELAKYYHGIGVPVIGGGWHTHYCPEEALERNIDIVIDNDGEGKIRQVLTMIEADSSLDGIPGIWFKDENGKIRFNPDLPKVAGFDMAIEDLPFPDFGLIRYSGKMKYYPIGRIRGCAMNCEFCSVKGAPQWSSAKKLFDTVKYLVETRKAKNFFIVDDRLEGNFEETEHFFRLIAYNYGNSLSFTVQTRLGIAENPEFLDIMEKAGVRNLCIGFESPIDKELFTMKKGYTSRKMIEWTKILREKFWIHAMFIFGYPLEEKEATPITVKERERKFKEFLQKAKPHSIQIFTPVPLVGTKLRKRLEKEGRLFSEEIVPHNCYDGTLVCFKPDNMTIQELQETPIKIMNWFYSPWSFWWNFWFRISTFIPFDIIRLWIKGWKRWKRGWVKDFVKYGGHFLLRKWRKSQDIEDYIRKLEDFSKK